MKLRNDLRGHISTYMRKTQYSDEMETYLEKDNITNIRILLEDYIMELYEALCETLESDMDLQQHNLKTTRISEGNCLYSELMDQINNNLNVEETRVFRETTRQL